MTDPNLSLVREWRTPIQPLGYRDMWCVWDHAGVYEWMVHPDMGRNLLATGIKVDGVWCKVEQVGDWPEINAIQIRAVKRDTREESYPMTAATG